MAVIASLLLASLSVAATAPVERERLIAQTDVGKVVYRMVVCDPDTPPSSCHDQEQQRLTRHIKRYWFDAAVAKYGVVLTPAEQAAVERETAVREPYIQTSGKHFQALFAATLAIRRGEERDRVLADFSKQGITADELDRELWHLPTLAEAERAAAKDQVQDGRRAMREYYSRPYLIQHLRQLVRRRAADEHVSFDDAEEQFWAEVARDTHTRIVDTSFSMPSWKGILNQ